MDEPRNRRAWDSPVRQGVAIATLVSLMWAGVTWLRSHIVTKGDLQQIQYEMDYHVADLRLDFTNRALERLEQKMDQGGSLTPMEKRQYDTLIKEQAQLKAKREELAQTF